MCPDRHDMLAMCPDRHDMLAMCPDRQLIKHLHFATTLFRNVPRTYIFASTTFCVFKIFRPSKINYRLIVPARPGFGCRPDFIVIWCFFTFFFTKLF